ncbi:MAG: hypothetical protein ABFD18_08060 [Syntrophomonas sp.]
MKHFSSEEWRALGQGPGGEKDMVMEKHLLECDACLPLFLEGIDEAALEQARAVIPPDFTARTCALIEADARRKEKYPARFQNKGFLAYYAAAAVITIMLTGGGAFQALNHAARTDLPVHSVSQAEGKYETMLFNWPSRLQEKADSWLHAIEAEKHKEVK